MTPRTYAAVLALLVLQLSTLGCEAKYLTTGTNFQDSSDIDRAEGGKVVKGWFKVEDPLFALVFNADIKGPKVLTGFLSREAMTSK